MTFRLPPAIQHHTNKLWYLALWLPYIGIFQLVNRFPIGQPQTLPLSRLDLAVPFVPELLPLYVGYLPFYWWTVSRSENDLRANQIFYATHFQLLLCLPLYALWPVAMPRELFYNASTYNWAGTFWLWFDGPNNCFPSLHVSNCLMLLRFNWRRPWRWATAATALGIIASTVLVKQHYAVDIAGGAAVFVASCWFIDRVKVRGIGDNGWLTDRRGTRPANDRSM